MASAREHSPMTLPKREVSMMATGLTRLTFTVPKEMEPLLARAKKDIFYDCTQSHMIRELLMAGLNVLDEKAAKEKQRDEAPEGD